MAISKEDFEALGERYNTLKNKQASLMGLLESREKERDRLKSELLTMGFSEEELTFEKASELEANLKKSAESFAEKMATWEEKLEEAKSKLI